MAGFSSYNARACLKLWLLRHPLQRKLSQVSTLPSTDRVTTTIWAVFSFFLFLCLRLSRMFKFINKKWARETLKPTFNPNKKQSLSPVLSLSLARSISSLSVWSQCAMEFPGQSSNKPFSSKIWWCLLLRASCNHNKNHKGWSDHNIGYRMTKTSTKKLHLHKLYNIGILQVFIRKLRKYWMKTDISII